MATWGAARACIVAEKTPRNSSYLATWLYLGGWPACTPPTTWWTRTRLWRRTTTTKKTHQNRVMHLDDEYEKKIAVQKGSPYFFLIASSRSKYVHFTNVWIKPRKKHNFFLEKPFSQKTRQIDGKLVSE